MPRATMAPLIARVRSLVGDLNPPWTDDEIQDVLDRFREERRYVSLRPLPTLGPGGAVSYLEYEAEEGDLEEGELLNANYEPLSPSSADWLSGRFAFSAHTPPPVLLKAWHYDVYGAAAEICRMQAARYKDGLQVEAVGAELDQEKAFEALMALARALEARRPVRAGALLREEG
jgi:hypothetical protein